MPPHTRSQRRRQNARHQPRPNASARAVSNAPGATAELDAPTMPAPAEVSTPRPARVETSRAAGSRRRVISRPAPEPVDYTKDYAAARFDLQRIALWAALLFVAMVALYFSGLV